MPKSLEKKLLKELRRAKRKAQLWKKRVHDIEAALSPQAQTVEVLPSEDASTHTIPLSDADICRMQQYGIYSRATRNVAAKCGTTSRRVWKVARGREVSASIAAELLAELSRCDAAPKKRLLVSPFDKRTLSQFAKGGRYFGVFTEVSQTLKTSVSYPQKVALGHSNSSRVLDAIKAAIAARDSRVEQGGK